MSPWWVQMWHKKKVRLVLLLRTFWFFYSENVSHVGFYSHYFNFYYYNGTHFKTFRKEMFLETI